MVDTYALGAYVARRGGSSPFIRTNAPVVELVDTLRLRRSAPTGVQVRVLSGVQSEMVEGR